MLRHVIPSACALAALPLAVSRVYAAEGTEVKDGPAESITATKTKLIPVGNLPLYGEPALPELVYEPERQTAFHSQVSTLRKSVWQDVDKVAGTINTIQEGYGNTKKYGKDLVKYLQEDSGALPRAVFITVSGLGGIVAGYKGGFFRKTFLASTGLIASASVCYPHQAVDIGRVAWRRTSDEAKQLWQQARGKDTKAPPTVKQETEKETPAKDADTKVSQPEVKSEQTQSSSAPKASKDAVKVASKTETVPKETPQKDFGMSKEEDKDMYSTRSS